MRKLTFAQATLEAMAEEMKKDDKVYVIGEDIARQGGVFGQFKGLRQEFPGRVIDSPISETFFIGGGVGAAMVGARPVVDMHFAYFVGVCMDEILNQMAKARYMFGGQTKVPLVMRAPDGMTFGGAAQHSQSLEAFFIHIPGGFLNTFFRKIFRKCYSRLKRHCRAYGNCQNLFQPDIFSSHVLSSFS